NSLNSYIFPPASRFGANNFEGGDVIEHFDQLSGPAAKPARKALTLRDNEIVTRVDLAAPLAPGQTTTFDVAWHFTVPEHGAGRQVRPAGEHHLAGGAQERRRAAEGQRDADLEIPVEKCPRRGFRGESRLHVRRVELRRPHGKRLLPAVAGRHLEGRGRHVT